MAARPHGDLKRCREYVAGGVIKIGDFVMLASSGKVVVATAAPTALLGVALSYASADGKAVNIADDPEQEFLVEKDLVGGSQPSAQTDYFLNYDLVATTSTSYESNHKLDSSSGATTDTLPLRAVAPSRVQVSSNECVVRINQHSDRLGRAGV